MAFLISLLRFGSLTFAIFRGVVSADTLDSEADDFRRHFQSTVHGATKRFGLHDGEAEIVPSAGSDRLITPATVLGLRVND